MHRRAIAFAIGASGVGMLPVALTGGLVVQIRADFAMSLGAYGLAVASFFVSFGLSSRLLGSTSDRLGAIRSLRYSSVFICASLMLIGVAWSPMALSLGLIVAGAGNGLAQPGANRLLSRTITAHRLGTAFGLKQASIPLAGSIGGLSVPVFGLGVGWRWAFAAGAGIALFLAALTYLVKVEGIPPGSQAVRTASLTLNMNRLTVGAGLGALATAPLATFLIDSAVTLGMAVGFAGGLLALASGAGIGSRILAGVLTDLWPPKNQFNAVGVMLITGALGFIALALENIPVFIVGSFIAYVAGWSWNGVFHHGVVKYNHRGPGQATGVVQTGLALGAALGPILFAFIVESFSYSAGWSLMAIFAALSGCIILSAASTTTATESF